MNEPFHSEEMSSANYKSYIKTTKVVGYLAEYETWKNIHQTLTYVHERYYVSDRGNVYDSISKTLIHPVYAGDYYMVNLQSDPSYKNYPNWVKCYVHRLVCSCFNPVPNMENMQVDHLIPGKSNKIINRSTNLRFTTDNGNKITAYENGLTNYNRKFTEEDAIAVCEGLVQRLSPKEICEQCLHMPHDKTSISFIYNVKKGDSWKYISENYDIPTTGDSRQTFTDDEIHQMCRLFEQGKSNVEVLNELGYTRELLGDKYDNYRNVVSNIHRKANSTRISKNYNF